MPPDRLPLRQVHLDFHTSEHIPGVAEDFDPDRFADTLRRAGVASVTCFARCHHGYVYFDSKRFPERRHPHLRRNLLAEQIEACHKRSIRVPIYTTVQWDAFTAHEHPEWLAQTGEGCIMGTRPFEPGFYRTLLVQSPYREFLMAHVREILETFDADGLFFDIVLPIADASKWSVPRMFEQKMDPGNGEHQLAFGRQVIDDFKREMTALVRSLNKDCTIFYNAGNIGPADRPAFAAYTHLEVESLPSGGWGYLHFPVVQRYVRTSGLGTLGMTGKFHTAWGDFHSYKNSAALEFECFQMLALGAGCSIGDQLHPRGALDDPTYDLIGHVYKQVEQKEPWCQDARALVDVGVVHPEAFTRANGIKVAPVAMGVTRLLQEGAVQFDLIDPSAEFNPYKVLILPDKIPVDEALARKLTTYLKSGGRILASHHSGMDAQQTEFTLEALGVTGGKASVFDRPFVQPRAALQADLPAAPHVLYGRGVVVEPARGTEILADQIDPYFQRAWIHYCSHRQTPSGGKIRQGAIFRNRPGNCIYFAHPVFSMYHEFAPRWVKHLVLASLNLLLPEPRVRLKAPSSTLASLMHQPRERRHVLHVLHYVPERRATFDVIEDVVPIRDVPVSVRSDDRVVQVMCEPQHQPLPFFERDGRVNFTIPQVTGHQMVALALAK